MLQNGNRCIPHEIRVNTYFGIIFLRWKNFCFCHAAHFAVHKKFPHNASGFHRCTLCFASIHHPVIRARNNGGALFYSPSDVKAIA